MRIFVIFAFLLLAVSLLFSSPSQASRFSGSYLLSICDVDIEGEELVSGGHIACQSYISGVLDYHNVLQSMNLAPKVDLCIPPEVSIKELHAIVLKFLKTHGEHDGFIAAPAVNMALYQVYPCK